MSDSISTLEEKSNSLEKYTISDLTNPIPGENPSGKSLRYEETYDRIREARREDDGTLSRGVWEYDLKRSDWSEVESVGVEALISKTKDLQIAGWVGEAWINLEGLPGVLKSIQLIHDLCEKFWPSLYPEIEEDDLEYRFQFFDWYDNTLSQRLVLLPIADENYVDYPFTLADWLSAVHFESAIRRQADPARMIQKAEDKGQPILKKLQSLLHQLPLIEINSRLDSLSEIQKSFKELNTLLNQLMPESTVALDQFETSLVEMMRIYNMEKNQRDPLPQEHPSVENTPPPIDYFTPQEESTPQQPPMKSEGLTHEEAYAQIAQLASYFQTSDPHNPAAPILRRILQWQNKTITDIFAEMGSTPDEIAAFIRLIGGASQKI